MELLRVGEAADLLRVRPETVYRWVERGLLPSVRLGRLLGVDRKELERRLQGLPPRTAIEAKDGD
jgi:excisionase family DNA binding protein